MKVLDSKSFGLTPSSFVLFISFLFLLFFFGSGVIQAQPSLARMRNEATVQETGPVFSLRISKNDPELI